ncbi:MAG: hypothetical protein K0R78_35 [Pelosinus sp.]|jgi:hypothetical protein|nr:hypothetical protein [Pelosinus sp.]
MAMSKKLLLVIIFLQCYAFLAPLPALAYNTYHVAIVPLINTANCKDQEIIQLIETKVKDKFKFPFYEIIPTQSVTTALQKRLLREKITNQSAMKKLSTDLPADIIIAIELVHAESRIVRPFFWSYDSDDETYLDTNVLVKCYTYSAKKDTYLSLKGSSYGLEPMRIDTNLYNSVEEAMDQIIRKLPYKRVPDDVLDKNIESSLSDDQVPG